MNKPSTKKILRTTSFTLGLLILLLVGFITAISIHVRQIKNKATLICETLNVGDSLQNIPSKIASLEFSTFLVTSPDGNIIKGGKYKKLTTPDIEIKSGSLIFLIKGYVPYSSSCDIQIKDSIVISKEIFSAG